MRQITKDLNSATVLLGKKRKLLCCPYVEFQKSCVGLSKFMSIFFFFFFFFFEKHPKVQNVGTFSTISSKKKQPIWSKLGAFLTVFCFCFCFFSFKFYFLLKSVTEGNTTIIFRGAPFDFQGAWKLGSGKAAIFFFFFLTPQMDEGFFFSLTGGWSLFLQKFLFRHWMSGPVLIFFSSLSSAVKIFVLFCFVFLLLRLVKLLSLVLFVSVNSGWSLFFFFFFFRKLPCLLRISNGALLSRIGLV